MIGLPGGAWRGVGKSLEPNLPVFEVLFLARFHLVDPASSPNTAYQGAKQQWASHRLRRQTPSFTSLTEHSCASGSERLASRLIQGQGHWVLHCVEIATSDQDRMVVEQQDTEGLATTAMLLAMNALAHPPRPCETLETGIRST